MKKILPFFVCVTSVIIAAAQQDPQFSQNMFNKLANNPGFAGSRQAVCATVLHRSQWMGFEDAPTTLNLSVDAGIPLLHGGVGLNIVKDDIAGYSNLGLQASYAYHADLGNGQVGLGISLGMFQSGLDGSFLKAADQGDNTLPTANVLGSALDLGAGLYYNTQDVYIGLSTAHITEPDIEKTDGDIIGLNRHYFLIAGYYHELNPLLSLNPSIYLKSDGATSQLDINTNLIYNNKIWGGVSYRLDEGLVLLSGMNINEDLKFGLAYDVVMSKIGNNSIEFMLGYDFKVKYDKATKRYQNPRFL